MLKQIPTQLIAGPLGAGKTSLLQNLLRQKPADQRWALLINEFGQIGLDLALLSSEQSEGISLSEIPGGCLCCVNGLPFQVGLNRLLRKARPDRLFIEASGLGHPVALMRQLAEAPWRGVLALQPLVMVLDAAALAAGKPLNESQQQALPLAGLLLCNKAEQLDLRARETLQQRFKPQPVHFTEYAELDWQLLPALPAHATAGKLPESTAKQSLPTIWLNPQDWQPAHQLLQAPYSCGWRMSPKQRFSLAELETWLRANQWLRAKGIVHTEQGWKAFNLLPGAPMAWQASPWRQDNRLELIVAEPADVSGLEQGLRAAALSQ